MKDHDLYLPYMRMFTDKIQFFPKKKKSEAFRFFFCFFFKIEFPQQKNEFGPSLVEIGPVIIVKVKNIKRLETHTKKPRTDGDRQNVIIKLI